MKLNKMTEGRQVVVICCSDPRLHSSRSEFEEEMNSLCFSGGVYLISLPGASKDLVEGNEERRDNFLRHIGIFVDSQENKNIVILICHHRDCQAYKRCMSFDSPKEEKEEQTKDMRRARYEIIGKFPKVEVILLWDNLLLYVEGGESGIEIIP